MRTFETQVIPARSHTVCTEVTCALCKRSAPYARPASDDNWAKDNYDVDKVTITREEGSRYPEGGNSKTTKVDVCPECFDSKVVPALMALGATAEDFITTETDY